MNNFNNFENELDEDGNKGSEDRENFILSFYEEEKGDLESNKHNNNIDDNKNNIKNDNYSQNKINQKSQKENLVKNNIKKNEYTPYNPNKMRNNDTNYYNDNNYFNVSPNFNYINKNNIKIEQQNLLNKINYIINFDYQQQQNPNQSFYYKYDYYQINAKKDY